MNLIDFRMIFLSFIHATRSITLLCIPVFLLCNCNSIPQSNEKSILIKNGTIINYDGALNADILIRGEKIIKVDANIKPDKYTRIIDASGLEILPGGIDPHVHVTEFADDFTSASKAALTGGITTLGEITFPEQGQKIADRLAEVAKEIESMSYLDVMVTPDFPNTSIENQDIIPKMAAEGYASLKIFTISEAFRDDVSGFVDLMKVAKEHGVLPMLHCEDFGLIKKAQDSLISQEKTSIYYYAESRPVEAEIRATEWAIQVSESFNLPVYIVHLSSEKALDLCAAAQERGVQVYVETRPLYLYFTNAIYKREDGRLYTGMPPLRTEKDQEALWEGLANGSIHTIGSDHAPHTLERKQNPENNIIDNYSGSSNLQLMLPMLYSEGVLKGRIPIERLVEVSSTNPAKLFGLFPRKGIIAVGSDADIVIWDKTEKRQVDEKFGYSKAGYSIYKGFEVTGWPKYTIRRGELLLDDGTINPDPGKGILLKRNRWRPFDTF